MKSFRKTTRSWFWGHQEYVKMQQSQRIINISLLVLFKGCWVWNCRKIMVQICSSNNRWDTSKLLFKVYWIFSFHILKCKNNKNEFRLQFDFSLKIFIKLSFPSKIQALSQSLKNVPFNNYLLSLIKARLITDEVSLHKTVSCLFLKRFHIFIVPSSEPIHLLSLFIVTLIIPEVCGCKNEFKLVLFNFFEFSKPLLMQSLSLYLNHQIPFNHFWN